MRKLTIASMILFVCGCGAPSNFSLAAASTPDGDAGSDAASDARGDASSSDASADAGQDADAAPDGTEADADAVVADAAPDAPADAGQDADAAPDADPFATCEALARGGCGGCLAAGPDDRGRGCGWCGETRRCFYGTELSPFRSSCSGGWIGTGLVCR